MKYLFLLLLVVIMFSGCELYNIEYEKYQILCYLDNHNLITGNKDIDQITILRNYIHHNSPDVGTPMAPPLTADEFISYFSLPRGTYCQGKTLLLKACLEILEIPSITIGMYTGIYTASGIEYSHSILLVYIDDKWTIQDTLYNIMLVDLAGNPITIENILTGTDIYYTTNGYVQRHDPSLGVFNYSDYFNGLILYNEIPSMFIQ